MSRHGPRDKARLGEMDASPQPTRRGFTAPTVDRTTWKLSSQATKLFHYLRKRVASAPVLYLRVYYQHCCKTYCVSFINLLFSVVSCFCCSRSSTLRYKGRMEILSITSYLYLKLGEKIRWRCHSHKFNKLVVVWGSTRNEAKESRPSTPLFPDY